MQSLDSIWQAYQQSSHTGRALVTAMSLLLCGLAWLRFRRSSLSALLLSFVIAGFSARFLHDFPAFVRGFDLGPIGPLVFRTGGALAAWTLFATMGRAFSRDSLGLAAAIGVSATTLAVLGLSTLGLQGFLGQSSSGVAVATIAAAAFIFAFQRPWRTQISIDRNTVVLLALALSPLLLNLAMPSAPDADIHTHAELLGYLAQGKKLLLAASGVPGEVHSFRYPAGFSAAGLAITGALGLGASDSLLILWGLSYALLLLALNMLSQTLRIPAFFTILFVLGDALTSSQGLGGGQSSKMLSYALGIYSISVLCRPALQPGKKALLTGLLLSASMAIQPIVAIPFILAGAGGIGLAVRKSPHALLRLNSFVGFTALLFGVFYLYLTTTGSSLQSQPALLLSELTPLLFVKNILRWGWTDFRLPFFLLAIPALFWIKSPIERANAVVLNLWLLGALLIDGLFGDTHWAVRFQGGFSQLALFGVSVGICVAWVRRSRPRWQRTLEISLVILWCVLFAPTFTPGPYESLTTSSDVRLGRWIRENLPQNALIMNATLPGAAYYYSWALRGNSFHDTVSARITDHQLKALTLRPREPFYECLSSWTREKTFPCLQALGATHLFVSSENTSPQTLKAVANLGEPSKRIGDSLLYDLKTPFTNPSP